VVAKVAGLKEPVGPCGQSFASSCGEGKDRGGGIDIADVPLELVPVNAGRIRKIDLIDKDHVSFVEHDRILLRLFGAFRYTANDSAQGLAEIEGRWTDEIANVLDNEQIEVVYGECLECAFDHARIEMAHGSGRDLMGANAERFNPLGIEVGLKIAFNDGDPQLSAKSVERSFEQRRLSCSGRRHQVHDEHTFPREAVAIRNRCLLVGIQYIGLD
jgi:hypothetical protein